MTIIRPAKHLGQHFLNNPRVIERIVGAINPQQGQSIAEIGPGTGALTHALLAAGAHVLAIEMDERCWPVLESLGTHLTLIKGDALALTTWLPQLPPHAPIVGNLPYNVGTEIVTSLLLAPYISPHSAVREARHPMIFMLQKEVIQRICAKPGTSDWGRLGILCQLLADCKRLFDVPPGAFTPPPKVMSSIVAIHPLPAPRFPVDLNKLDIFLRTVFTQRRKMLRGTLKGKISEKNMLAIGINPTQRPEELTLEQVCGLARII